jgi:hypothetical protein
MEAALKGELEWEFSHAGNALSALETILIAAALAVSIGAV